MRSRHNSVQSIRIQEDKTLSLEFLLDNLDLSFLWPILRPNYSLNGWVSSYDSKAMFKALLVKEIRQFSSRRKLADFLRKDQRWLRKCGFKRPPHHDSFSAFIERVGINAFRGIFNEYVRRIGEIVKIGRIIAIDSTLFQAYSRYWKNRENSDPDAKWGYSATKDSFVFGYKVHIACDAELELPLAFTVTPANVYDGTEYLTLLEDLTNIGIRPEVVLADAGYDSKANILQTIERYKATPIIAMNPRNMKKNERDWEIGLPIKRNSKEWKYLYRKRGSVERIFSRLKEELDMKAVKVRGLDKVKTHVTFSMITMLTVALVALKTGNGIHSTSVNSFRF